MIVLLDSLFEICEGVRMLCNKSIDYITYSRYRYIGHLQRYFPILTQRFHPHEFAVILVAKNHS